MVLDFEQVLGNSQKMLTVSELILDDNVEVSVELVKPNDQFFVLLSGSTSYGPFVMILRAGKYVVFRDPSTGRVFRSRMRFINDKGVVVGLSKRVHGARDRLPMGYIRRHARHAKIGTVLYVGKGKSSPLVLGPCFVRDKPVYGSDDDKLLFVCKGVWYRASMKTLDSFGVYMKRTRFDTLDSVVREVAACARVIVLNFDQTIVDFNTKVVPYRSSADVRRLGGVEPYLFASASVLFMLLARNDVSIYVVTDGYEGVVQMFMKELSKDFPDDHILASGGVKLANKNEFLRAVAIKERVADVSQVWLVDCSVPDVNAARTAGFSAFHCPADTGMTDYQWELFAEQLSCEKISEGGIGIGAGVGAGSGSSLESAVPLPPVASQPQLRKGVSGLGGADSKSRARKRTKTSKYGRRRRSTAKARSKSKSHKRRSTLRLRRQPRVRGSW